MRKSVETQIALVRAFEETGSYAKSARRLRLGRTTIFKWLELSGRSEEAGDTASEFYFAMDDAEEPDYLHNHMRAHLDAAVEDVEAGLIKLAAEGYYTPRSYHGETVWKKDPALIGYSEDDLKMLGYDERDRYLKDANGNLIPEMDYTPPTVERALAVLAAHSDKWKKHSKVDANLNIGGGVQVAHWLPGQQQPKQLPKSQAKPLPQVEIIPDEVVEAIIVEVDEEPATPEPVTAPEPVERATADVRRAVNPGTAELLRLAAMSPEDRAAEAARRVKR